MNKLNILNLATSEQGGAGIASQYFNELFIKAGHNSILVVKQSKIKNKNIIVLQDCSSNYSIKCSLRYISNVIYRLYLKINVGPIESKYSFFDPIESKQYYHANDVLKIIPFKPDIIIFHWVSNFINSKTIKEFQKQTKAKLFWIMMDNAPITGGCHYPWDCKGFERDCSNCPAILNSTIKNITQCNLKFKEQNLPNDLELITCSESDHMRALKSSVFKTKKIHKILFPLDENKYCPGNKKDAKSFFEIEVDKKIIFYGFYSLKDKRKGGLLLLKALLLLQDELEEKKIKLTNFLILIAGIGYQDIGITGLKIPIKLVSYLNEENLIRAYQASDVFVSASLEDSGPMMVNQSIMCGTPVVSFDLGVAIDIVQTGKTGYRAITSDYKDLAKGIESIILLPVEDYELISYNCRVTGIRQFSTNETILRWNKLLLNK